MAIVKCLRGHYYDDSKHSACPHCGSSFDQQGNGDETVSLGAEEAFVDQQPEPVQKQVKEEVDVVVEKKVPASLDNDKTIGAFSFEMGTEKVTGWLVCTEGPQYGRDYRIFHGWTRIGRDPGMTICINNDEELSRNSHFAVVYDDRSGKFFAVNENGSLTYLNGESLMTPMELKYGDEIKAGKTTMVFIPFCSEGRKW